MLWSLPRDKRMNVQQNRKKIHSNKSKIEIETQHIIRHVARGESANCVQA